MITNVVSQASPRARALQARTLRSAGSSLLRTRHRQQSRAYRYGMWSSYLDPEFHRELRRRHQILKQKYAETVNMRLSWEDHPLAEESREAMGRLVGRYWYPAPATCGSHYANGDGIHQRQREAAKDSEADLGRYYMSSSAVFDYDSWRTQLNDVVNQWTKQASQTVKRSKSDLAASELRSENSAEMDNLTATATMAEEEFVIDPISNRKVLRKTYGPVDADAPVSTFKSYRSQFRAPAPPEDEDPQPAIFSDGPPPTAELNQYEKVEIDEWSSDDLAAGLKVTDPLVMSGEEYALNHLPAEEGEDYNDLDKYKPNLQNESYTSSPDSASKYEDLHKYQPTEHDAIVHGSEDPVVKYDDLHNYKPTEHDEISDITRKEGEQYEDLDKYSKPFRHQEAAILAAETAPQTQQYDDLHQYKPQIDEIAEVAESSKYEDLDDYQKPFMHKEGDITSSHVPKYGDLGKYQDPVYHQESKSATTNLEYDDLEKYNPQKFEDHVAEQDRPFAQYGDLEGYKYFRYQELEDKAQALEEPQDVVEEHLQEGDSKHEAKYEHGMWMGTQQEPPESTVNGWTADEMLASRQASDDVTRSTMASMAEGTAKMEAAASQQFKPEGEAVYTPRQPSTYKVLAYDPATQNVEVTETTSTVADHAKALTVAEAIMRLSNPSAFFPHFEDLQASGFEIISGAGDVLVFRKVRDATTEQPAPRARRVASSVNPIDMMGQSKVSPNAAAFASPTGFVNYDLPPTEDSGSGFRSNIDVRREEPVFSGPKPSLKDDAKPKKNLTKRILYGGVWVAGFSYALGVIGDYFKTGGADGQGPKGF